MRLGRARDKMAGLHRKFCVPEICAPLISICGQRRSSELKRTWSSIESPERLRFALRFKKDLYCVPPLLKKLLTISSILSIPSLLHSQYSCLRIG